MSSTADTKATLMLGILGLKPGATLVEVKQARTDLIKVWHPDRFLQDACLQVKAEEKLKEINAAYEWLCLHPDSLRFDLGTSAPAPSKSFRRTASDRIRPTPPHQSGKPPYSEPQSADPSPKAGLSDQAKLNLMRAGFLVLGLGWLVLVVSFMGSIGVAVGPLIAYGVYRLIQELREL